MGKYLDEAREFYEEARREFMEGKRENNLVKLRDASEKAWGAVVLAIHELFEKRSIPIPKSHKGRRDFLRELERSDPEIKRRNFLDRFSARAHHLHEQCFYEGYCEADLIEEEMGKVEEFLAEVEQL